MQAGESLEVLTLLPYQTQTLTAYGKVLPRYLVLVVDTLFS
jgi:hypothetical protein